VIKAWDIVIIGGGLGGLALAAELASPQFSKLSVLVIEKRKEYVRDRTWSYWSAEPHRYSHLERRQWNKWSVSLGDAVNTQNSQRTHYASLDADAFYQAAVKAIDACRHVELQMNTGVASVESTTPFETLIHLDKGGPIRAHRVFDARPAQHQSTALVQQFVGWEVQLECDVFNPGQVHLMGFEPNPNGLHFFYVLPYNARCALIESTWISRADWQPNYDAELKLYIAKLCGNVDYTISYREHGVLSLQDPSSKFADTIGLGRRGGALRPSTGYAFIDTLDHAKQLAQSLSVALQQGALSAWKPMAFQRAATDHWMDAVFLDVLAANWEQAPRYFMQLFKSVAVDDTLAFLTGKATWIQRLRIMRSLPIAPFLRAALMSNFLVK
jgi:lycopene beta-cyclase